MSAASLLSRLAIAVVLAFGMFGAWGCSDGDGGGSSALGDAVDTGGGGGFDFGGGSDGGFGADGGGDAATDAGSGGAVISPDAPARNPACEQPPLDAHGAVVPWAGFDHKGTLFTCNRCPGGDPVVQGTWRAVNGETRDPATPLSGGFRERVVIDGNTWQVRNDADSAAETLAQGWYFCSDKEELGSQRVVFVTTDVDPDGGFGWSNGAVFTGLFLVNGPNRLMWQAYEGFETGAYADFLYCRVGSTVDGSPCEDPFGS